MIKNVFISNYLTATNQARFDYTINVPFPVNKIKAFVTLTYNALAGNNQNQQGILKMFNNDLAIAQTNWIYTASGSQVYETAFNPPINISGKYEVQLYDPISMNILTANTSGLNVLISLTFLG